MFCGQYCIWKKEVKYNYNFRLAHFLLFLDWGEAGVVGWCFNKYDMNQQYRKYDELTKILQ